MSRVGIRSYVQPADYRGTTIHVPFEVDREDHAHVVMCEWTGVTVARIRRKGKRYWVVQVEESGEVLTPFASSMNDALFDLAQHLIDVDDPGLGPKAYW